MRDYGPFSFSASRFSGHWSRGSYEAVVQTQDRNSEKSNLVIGMYLSGGVHPQVERFLQREDVPRSSGTFCRLVDSVIACITKAPPMGTQSKRAVGTSC